MRRAALATTVAVLTLGQAQSAGAASPCTTVDAAAGAAKALYGPGTELMRTERVAGLRTALVLEPRIAPGTRRRMVRAGAGWCDAAAGFNRAWQRADDGAATAAAYASLAAAPYFDGVTVKDVARTAAGAYVVRTHARTNGVEARWIVVTDATGVRRAQWTATDFAVKPFAGEFEGLTALPGATESYTAAASGLLAEARGLPTVESARRANAADPSIPAVYTGPDGMHIRLSVGDSHVALDPGVRTGVDRADVQQNFMEAISLNYQEFHDWGLRKGWTADLDPVTGPDAGWVYVNDALSLYCLACVFIADDFQIHMISEVPAALGALGFTGFGDEHRAFIDALGHEMFHNFQNAYNNPGPLGRSAGRGTSTAYSEGTARFQETLHSYSDVSFHSKTLVTGGQTNPPGLSLDLNHCNGYQEDDVEDAFLAGPFPKTYNACYFWTSWFNQNGRDAFLRLVTEAMPANSPKANLPEGVGALAAAAPGTPVADQLSFFAYSALTGRGKTISALSGDPTPRDWGTFFFRWQPPALERGEESSKTVNPAGVFGRRLARGSRVSLAGDGLALYMIQTKGKLPVRRLAAAGANVPAGAWVVGVNPTDKAVNATLKAE